MPIQVNAPLAGTAVGLADVPDPVFSTAMVGPGPAIDRTRGPGTVVAPIADTLVKLKPHALVVLAEGGRGVLVHLGIDTVKLDGEGFTLLASEGETVQAGQPVIKWDPAAVEARGLSPVCPVIALDAGKYRSRPVRSGRSSPARPCSPGPERPPGKVTEGV